MARYDGKVSKGKEKPCPTCYAPMRMSREGWACLKHGTLKDIEDERLRRQEASA